MKIHVLSDLHLEFEPFVPPSTDADVVVLAGDIGLGVEGLEWARDAFKNKPVVYVPGNHEFYGHTLEPLRRELAQRAKELDVHLLDDGAAIIDGVRFLGATLWTDFMLFGPAYEWPAREAARHGMADCKVIRDNLATLTPERMMALHGRSRAWLGRELAYRHSGPTVVVTHHLPSIRSVAQRFSTSLLSPAFASNLDNLVEMADLWIHGHTHDTFDYELGNCRVVCNPRGYPGENRSGFQPGLVVELTR